MGRVISKESKVWGLTELLEREDSMHLHRITFEAGGVCSEHLHEHRANLFYVLSGELIVRTWDEEYKDRITDYHLRAHDFLTIPSGVRHQFEGVKSGVALEIYWDDAGYTLNENDIVRFTQGYMR